MSPVTSLLLDVLEQAFRKKSWHGTNLLGAVRGITPEAAAWRPAPDRRNIWEHLVHAAYWKYSVWRRLAGGEKGSFPLEGSNWFPRPEENTPKALQKDIKLLKEIHENLLEAVRTFPPERLIEVPKGSSFTYQQLITGAAAHDLYHCGQIQLLKRLQRVVADE
jgi:hypothetical protein